MHRPLLLAALCLMTGCPDTNDTAEADGGEACILGQSLACTCLGGLDGVQICEAGPRLGPCLCVTEDGGVSDGGDQDPDGRTSDAEVNDSGETDGSEADGAQPDAAMDDAGADSGAIDSDAAPDDSDAAPDDSDASPGEPDASPDDPDAGPVAECDDGTIETQPCGLNGRGRQSRTCVAGQFGAFGECADLDTCVDAVIEARVCGPNESGRESRDCTEGSWTAWSACFGAEGCQDGAEETDVCGLNGRGTDLRTCADGAWTNWLCTDPDQCIDGQTQSRACDGGTQTRDCVAGRWRAYGPCEQELMCDAPEARCLACLDGDEPDDTAEDATRIPTNQLYTGVVCSDVNRVDYLSIAPTGPVVATAELTWRGEAGATMTMEGGVEHDNSVEALPDGANALEVSWVSAGMTPPLLTVGHADGGRPATLSYTVQVETRPLPLCQRPDEGGCIPCGDHEEPNNDRANATVLDVHQFQRNLGLCGSGLSDPRDVYVAALAPGETGVWHISFFPDEDLNFGARPTLEITGPGGPLPLTRVTRYTISFPVAQAGDYFFDIRAGGALRYEFVLSPNRPAQCNDRVDNDGDGDVDTMDSGCSDTRDDSETAPDRTPTCDDGIDNDQDGATDYPADLDCVSRGSDDEGAAPQAACGNLRFIEANGQVITPFRTSGREDRHAPSCTPLVDTPDFSFFILIETDGVLRARVESADFDTVLTLREGCYGEELECNDDGEGLGMRASIVTFVSPGLHQIVIDGFTGASGEGELFTEFEVF